MALTHLWCDGAEHGRDFSTTANANAGIGNTITNPGATPGVNIQSGGAYGSYCYRCAMTSGGGAAINKTVAGSPDKLQVFFRFKVITNPATNAQHMFSISNTTAGGSNCVKLGLNTNGTIRMRPNGASATGEQTGPNVNDGAWHTVELQVDYSANPWSIAWWVDGVAQTNGTRAVAADTVVGCIIGAATAPTEDITVDYDDWIFGSWTSSADRYGNVKVLGLSPGSDGTHNTAGAVFINGDTATTPNFTNSTTNAYSYLDDMPISLTRSTTDNISAETHVNGEYLEIKNVAASSGEPTALCVTAWLAYSSPSTNANAGSVTVVRTSAGTDNEIFGNFTTGADYSETSNWLKSVLVPNPGSWTKTELDAIKFRIGRASNSSDVSPRPTWQALLTQVAYPVTVTVNGTAALSVPHSLVVAGTRKVLGTAVSTPTDVLTVAGLRKVFGTAVSNPADALVVAGLRKVLGIATLSGLVPTDSDTIKGYKATIADALHGWRHHFVAVPTTGYKFSFYAKRGTATDVKYSVYDWSNFADIVGVTSYYSTINSSTWTRVTVSFTAPAGATDIAVYLLRDSGALGTVYLAAPQVEAAISATAWERTTDDDPGIKNLLTLSEDLTSSTGDWQTFNGAQISVAQDANFHSAPLHAWAFVTTPSGPDTIYGTAALSAVDAMVVSALRSVFGTGVSASTASLTVAGKRTVSGVGAFAPVDVLTVSAVRKVLAAAALSDAVALQVAGVRTVLASAGFSPQDQLTALGHVVSTIMGTSTFTVSDVLRVLGAGTPPGKTLRGPEYTYSPSRGATGFIWPQTATDGTTVWAVSKRIQQVPYMTIITDRSGNEWRLLDNGLIEPV